MLKQNNLVCALSAALFAMITPVHKARATDLDGVTIDLATDNSNGLTFGDGNEHAVRASTITTRGVQSHGIYAQSGSNVAVSDTRVDVAGDRSRALWAVGNGTRIVVTGGKLSTHGKATTPTQTQPLGPGVAIASGGAYVELNGTTITSSGQNGDGLNSEGGSILVMNGGSIETTGLQAKGLSAYGSGTHNEMHLTGVTLATRGNSAVGAVSNGRGGNLVTLADSSIATYGSGSHGLEASAGSQLLSRATDVATAGSSAHGLIASGVGSTMAYSDGRVIAQGPNSHGVLAQSGAGVAISRASIDATATGIRAMSGAAIDLQDADVTTHQDYAHGIEATGDGSTVTGNNVTVATSGFYSYGLRANEGGLVELSNVNARTAGDFGHGAIADTAGSRMALSQADIVTGGGAYAMGVRASNGGSVDIAGGSVTTDGDGSYGINAIGEGSQVRASALRVETRGSNAGGTTAAGIVAEWGGQIDLESSQVLTHGDSSIGLLAQVSGDLGDPDTRLDARNVEVTTIGDHAYGAMACALVAGVSDACAEPNPAAQPVAGAQAKLTMEGSHIATNGAGSHGLYAYGPAGATVHFSGGTVSTVGNEAHGAVADAGASLSLLESDVRTSGDSAIGVQGIHNAILAVQNSSVASSGGSAHGVSIDSGAQLMLERAQVSTSGEGAFGIIVQGDGSHAQMKGLQVATSSRDAAGLSVGEGSASAMLEDSQIHTRGVDSSAAQILTGGVVNISGSALIADAAAALRLDEGTLTATDAATFEGNGTLAELLSDRASAMAFDHDVVALGDIRFADSALDAAGDGALDRTSSLSLDNNSYWKGATDAIGELSLANGSRWDVTGDSQVGELSLATSNVVFDHADGRYKTLVVDGSFQADNAHLTMNTALGDDTSLTDLLHVQGDTAGNAFIAVNNIGGTGAQTTEGIRLVQVDGVSAAQFALEGRAVGGAYEYFLHQSSRTSPNDGDWYLRSELPAAEPQVDPCADEQCALDPPVAPVPIFRPEGGAYLANQASALGMFNLDLHARVGEPNLAQRQRGDGNLASAWVRVASEQPRYRINDQLAGQGRQNVLQVGSDLTFWGSKDRGVVGVMAASGQATNRITSALTGYAADGRVDGRALGVYGTWLQDADVDGGLYVDGWLQAARFKNRVEGDALTQERYRSNSLSASLEAGYALRLHQDDRKALYLEPQVQVIWTDYHLKGDQYQEATGTVVKVGQAGGIQTRVGARLYGHSTSAGGNRVQPFAAVNWLRNNGAPNSVWMDEESLRGISQKDLYEAKVGAQLQLSRRLTGWGELSSQHGQNGFRSMGALLGLKYAW